MHRLEAVPPHPEPPLALPPSPPEPARAGFPLLATLAPVIGALGLWAVTGSMFSLMFAALGPIVAVASVFDARRLSRRQRRRAEHERAVRLDDLHGEIDARHARERAAAWRRSPSARLLVDSAFAPHWRDGTVPAIVLGRGAAPSALRVDGAPVGATDRAVLERAARLDDAPVLADPEGGIGFVGALPIARAAARAVVVQGANHAIPGALTVELPEGAAWRWGARLPHVLSADGGHRVLRVVEALAGAMSSAVASAGEPDDRRNDVACLVAVAPHASSLPPGLRTVVRLDGPAVATVHRPGDAPELAFVPDLLGEAEALQWAAEAARAADRAGLGAAGILPPRVRLGDLEQPTIPSLSRSTLTAAVGAVTGGPLEIDLVRDGPHALVAGTTGSGKSEFLLAWITALALAHRPDRVSFLLVDFKGGAAFEPIRALPHVTGIVTDLDEAEAERAVMSLRAELRHRESVLLREGARDIAELDPTMQLARLVIVVDEFQAMIERFPDLGAVIADIAARGRSLGVHLVLASQRPNGVVREQVVANCAIRVSLRVVQRADSIAVVGTPAAARIRPDSPGRGVVDRGDGCPVPFQSAIADAAAIRAAGSRHSHVPRSRRPWLDPLPRRITAAELAGFADAAGSADLQAIVFGVVDEPELQRRGFVSWSPDSDGHLLVLGMPGSGRSTALTAVADAMAALHGRGSVVMLDGPRSEVWDTMAEMLDGVRHGTSLPRLVVIDDLDTRFRSWPDEYRHAILESLEAILREGRARGLAVAAATSQPHGLSQAMRDAFGDRVLLRHPTRSDLVQAGGAGELWRASELPGAGQWRGRRVQLVTAPTWSATPTRVVPRLELVAGRVHAVASARPRADADTLRSLGHAPVLLAPGGEAAARLALESSAACGEPALVLVGDADAWASNWSVAAAIREDAVVVVHGGAAEYRALVRDRTLPPLLDDGGLRQCWVVHPGEPPGRALWPVGVVHN
ncbi:FtsK/SpoIIIE domain-containing protein [Agromyces ramosus]|uniref:S-DNA-T family DNA segregation ATPase FtsK/SpoIIIE n=1 Tax=Agromyces ramosus TaxID=33879 RepID=A0ABU0RBV7_9MICO|nr:FtsK/SpoIIIE domain-containing protein [Agromyces ramosus]MDQ0895555.1 S-DNA-T family DNA segregation ATPase FtsK/SpoIIIE [Agromyces ramosus]